MSIVRQTLLMGDDEKEGNKSYRNVFSTRYTTTMGIAFGRQTTKFDIPIHDHRAMLDSNVKRHEDDARFVEEFDDNEDARFFKYKPLFDDLDICPKDPSYSKFKCPMEIDCKERLKKDTVRYNNQLMNEISKLIDYQKNALEAAYFVKVMSYTTLWPPYHSNLEIANTSRTFYRLSKKEQTRYNFIMSHDFS